MSPLAQAIAAQRARLERIEHNGQSEIAATYQRVADRLQRHLDQLARDIAAAEAAHVEVRPGWLFAQDRYRLLLSDLERHTHDFLTRTIAVVTGQQRDAVQQAPRDAGLLTVAALGHASQRSRATVLTRFGRLPAGALERLVGYAGDGQPLGALIRDIAPRTAQRVKDTLAFGVAAGRNPRDTAREVMTIAGVERTRALAISRTETLRAYREATDDAYRHSRVVQSWVWLATLDDRTCAACLAQQGSVHSLGEPMATHTNCRCSKVPRTMSWAQLGFAGIPDGRPSIPDGEQVFASMTQAQKLAVLGPTRARLLASGSISVADLVAHTHSPRWGNGSRAATVRELHRITA